MFIPRLLSSFLSLRNPGFSFRVSGLKGRVGFRKERCSGKVLGPGQRKVELKGTKEIIFLTNGDADVRPLRGSSLDLLKRN